MERSSKCCGWWIAAGEVGGRKNFPLNTRRTFLALEGSWSSSSCSGVLSWAVSQNISCSVLSPGQPRGWFPRGAPQLRKLRVGASSARGSSSPQIPGAQGLRQQPIVRPDSEASPGRCSPPISAGACSCVTSAQLELGDSALLLLVTAPVPSLEGPGTSEMSSQSPAGSRGSQGGSLHSTRPVCPRGRHSQGPAGCSG